MTEVVANTGVIKDAGYLYYLGKDGNVWRTKMARGRKKTGGGPEMVATAGVTRADGFLYYLDKGGNVARSPMARGRKFFFEGVNHRLFIEGRGFDFRKLSVNSLGSAVLELSGLEDKLYSLLDFEEPRVIYVVSRAGSEDLILQGCRIKAIAGDDCRLSYSKYQRG